jgi:hypothetical protein
MSTKIFDIIHLNGQSYMVEHGQDVKIPKSGHFILGRKSVWRSEHTEPRYTTHLSEKIVASTDTSLGLPLLPAFEENIEELAKKTLGYTPISLLDISNFKAGYKAAKVKMAQQVEVQIDENGDIEIKDGFVIVKSWISRTFVE